MIQSLIKIYDEKAPEVSINQIANNNQFQPEEFCDLNFQSSISKTKTSF